MNRYTVIFMTYAAAEIEITVSARNRDTAVYKATRLLLVNYSQSDLDDVVCYVARVLLHRGDIMKAIEKGGI